MRLVSFNILNGRHPADDHVDVDAFAAAVASLDADVLALQEVDRNQPRSGHADLTAVAAEAMGAVDSRFVAALSGSPGATWVAATGEEQPDAAAYGIALLSRRPVRAWQIIRLPVLRTRVPMKFRDSLLPTLVQDEPRVAVAADVVWGDATLTVANTHLSFVPWWNGRQLRSLVSSLETSQRPLVVTGDLNMDAERAGRTTRMRGLARHATFPAHAPVEQLDHVLADGPVTATATEARELPLSDHRALVVDLAL
ncbi:endonuclease/exonuclease/phosphatase family protein [Nocardioides abyssi]|uniref:Endonuclease/exonuclease/phosphatase family protein n=1 Tax=Nocardioides abyssi TaxID=3058370 RepID=A0ABT8EZ89_9ACTN|nr:endonuclease/exonuclease/phosphatase family protein [Nocardioides abyssi]MDN4163463.1 endonuclease/exonuclease/phosphatase family protein [Nocardioides abyssi]